MQLILIVVLVVLCLSLADARSTTSSALTRAKSSKAPADYAKFDAKVVAGASAVATPAAPFGMSDSQFANVKLGLLFFVWYGFNAACKYKEHGKCYCCQRKCHEIHSSNQLFSFFLSEIVAMRNFLPF